MTDTPENAENPTTQPMAPGARSAWGTLTRTTRIWTIALVAGAAALIAAAGLGLGVFVGTEHEHDESSESSEYVHEHRDGPSGERHREHDAHENDRNEAENNDSDRGGPTGQPAAPGVGGGSSVAPKPAPVPPR